MQRKIELLDHGYVMFIESWGADERFIEAARMSTGKGFEGWDKDEKLLTYLYNNKHSTPFEMGGMVIEVKAPIFVFREWHRHRTQCLDGDTLISFEMPNRLRNGKHGARKIKISTLARQWNTDAPVKRPNRQKRSRMEFNRARIANMKLRVFNEDEKEFTTGRITNVIESGVKKTYRITLENGKQLICTKDHRLLTSKGWQRLEDAVGLKEAESGTVGMTREASVLCNGVPVYRNFDWLKGKRDSGASVSDISELAGCSYHTIRKWLKKLDLKYSDNERGYKKGDIPWNKGVTGYSAPQSLTEAHKESIRRARSGENCNFWKGGITPERKDIARWTREQASKVHSKFNYTCQSCGKQGEKLHTHHVKPVVDHPELARDFDNLITLCESCHHVAHGRNGDGAMTRAKGRKLAAVSSKIIKIEPAGMRETFDITVEGPFHNFVGNGMVVHNSYNEMSGRYVPLPDENYIPSVERLMTGANTATDNKQAQGTGRTLTEHEAEAWRKELEALYEHAQKVYENGICLGVPKELARVTVPVARYSKMRASANLRNWLAFLTLRKSTAAQWEIRQYADAVGELIREHFPRTWALFEAEKSYG